MSNKRITDLTELTNPTTDDVFPVVDIATNTTTKVQLGNLPVPSSVTTALATKQDSLVSGTNIKTINSTSVLGSGNIAVQETLVSGTNIKTLNNTSLLGSGNITLTANPSGVSGAIQFSNGSAFASDAANLFWDDTNNRLGVGTNVPSNKLHIITDDATSPYVYGSQISQIAGSQIEGLFSAYSSTNGGYLSAGQPGISWKPLTYLSGEHRFSLAGTIGLVINSVGNTTIGNGTTTLSARLGIKGSGSTSATTSLLVQNSGGSTAMEVKDNLKVGMGGAFTDSNAGAYATVLSLTASYAGILFNSTAGTPTKAGIGLDSAKMFFGEETNGSTLFGYRAMIDLRNGGFVVKNDTAAGVNASLNASACLQADSTIRGFLPPRMTTTQKNAIASPAAGLVVYDSTLAKLCVYTTAWETITSL